MLFFFSPWLNIPIPYSIYSREAEYRKPQQYATIQWDINIKWLYQQGMLRECVCSLFHGAIREGILEMSDFLSFGKPSLS